jgi:GT2 family glycosyltransferase
MTSHNRREKTVISIGHYFACALPEGYERQLVLVDDGSIDGTAEAVCAAFPDVVIERGNGNLFWNRGMHRAQTCAMERVADYLLWLNDDTELLSDSIARLLETEHMLRQKYGQPVMVVGSTADRETGKLTYGGYVAPQRWRPFTYQRAWHATEPVECHAMNGNVVLIPMLIAQAVGNLDPVFEHAMGDTDYALRTRAEGFRIFVASGFVGHCSHNSEEGTYQDSSLPLSVRWKKMMSRKGLPPRSWGHFTHRHGGLIWPIYFIWPYFKLVAGEARRFRRGRPRT